MMTKTDWLEAENAGLKVACEVLHARIKRLTDEIERLNAEHEKRLRIVCHAWFDDMLSREMSR